MTPQDLIDDAKFDEGIKPVGEPPKFVMLGPSSVMLDMLRGERNMKIVAAARKVNRPLYIGNGRVSSVCERVCR